jgi:hypothetical protein
VYMWQVLVTAAAVQGSRCYCPCACSRRCCVLLVARDAHKGSTARLVTPVHRPLLGERQHIVGSCSSPCSGVVAAAGRLV